MPRSVVLACIAAALCEITLHAADRRDVRAIRVPIAPSIDGRMDDAAWSEAPRAHGFVQVEPVEGSQPSEATEFRIVYDDASLYIGVWCFDTDADAIVATAMARDAALEGDDHVTIVLDPFLNQRSGFLFKVNPNGARFDALISTNFTLTPDWDAIWMTASSRDAKGWYVEVAIPFKSLSFDAALETWGFNVERTVKRRLEISRWSGARQEFSVENLSVGGYVHGLEDITQGVGLDVVPFAVARYEDDRIKEDVDLLFDGGVDARYSITPGVTARLGYNTDFAETEVDSRQINLTRFPLFFPEKRDFFLEDAGIFEFGSAGTNMIPFFSRRVGLSAEGEPIPITVAGKLTGRIEEYNFGLVDALVEEHDALPTENTIVGRVSRNVFDESSVGAIITHGDPNSRDENLLAGTDVNWRESDLVPGWTLSGAAFLAGSWTEDVGGRDNLSFGADARAQNDVILTELDFYQVEPDFNPALGFVRRKDLRSYEYELTIGPWIKSSDLVRRVFVSYFQRHTTDLEDELDTAFHSLTPIFVEFEGGDQIFFNTQTWFDEPTTDFEIHPGVVIPPEEFWWQQYRLGFSTSDRRPLDLGANWDFGQFYDGRKDTYSVTMNGRPSRFLHFGVAYTLNQIRLDAGSFDTRLASARLGLNFTPDLTWNHLVQYDDVSDTIGVHSRLQWEFRPGSTLYVALNQGVDRNHGRLRGLQTELATKIGVTIRF